MDRYIVSIIEGPLPHTFLYNNTVHRFCPDGCPARRPFSRGYHFLLDTGKCFLLVIALSEESRAVSSDGRAADF